jgi:hypothetical protein
MTKIGFRILILVLCIVNMLLPIERSFPLIDFFGFTNVPIPVLLDFIILLFIAHKDYRSLLRLVNNTFFKSIACCSLFFAMTSIQSPYPKQSFSRAIVFFSTFGLNWLIIRSLSLMGYRKWITRAICMIGVLAAVVLIAEGYYKHKLPFYASFEKYAKLDDSVAQITERSWGTLGNPILSGVLLITIIPFALEIRPKWLRTVLTFIYISAAATTYSRIILLIGLTLTIGIMIIAKYKKRFLRTFLFISGAAVITLLLISNDNQELKTNWTKRIGGSDIGASENINSRIVAVKKIIHEYLDGSTILEMLAGHGWSWENETANRIADTGTIDNAYISVLYYYGMIGLVLFIMPFVIVLVRNKREATRSLHWYNIIALLSTGLAYTFIFYMTTNFVAVSSIAVIGLAISGIESYPLRCRRSPLMPFSSSFLKQD